jgi:signal transduction histidine kinase
MKLSIKNRIALYSVLGIASISLLVFIAIFFSVRNHSKSQIDDKLKFEAEKHIHELVIKKDTLHFVYKDEWLEREHIEIEVFPLFIELVDKAGHHLDKSPNLLDKYLKFDLDNTNKFIINYELNDITVRQIQIPLEASGEVVGYLGIATSFEDVELVLDALLDMLLIIYPVLLLVTFFTSRIISRITIKPITKIANRVSEIHAGNLDRRVEPQVNGDELETLSLAINDFLDRIDEALKREKQFTADASHQLRTPLAVMKGNLEILLRKKRNEEDYRSEITKAIYKIDEMTDAVEKLLILARLDKHNQQLNFEDINLYQLIEDVLQNYKKQLIEKNITIHLDDDLRQHTVHTKKSFLILIFDNLISNASKYAEPQSEITISVHQNNEKLQVNIRNQGPVIPAEDLDEIFIPFFRNKEHKFSEKGYGLGLAIVKKASEALDLDIQVSSKNHSTTFSVGF